jgi:DNA-binding protein HU-beta
MAGKMDVAEYLCSKSEGMSKKQAGELVDHVFECLGKHLASGERVSIPDFGTFSLSERAAREGRNPKTGAMIKIDAARAVRFKPGKALKESVNQ